MPSTAGLLSSSTASSAKANPPSDGSGGATADPPPLLPPLPTRERPDGGLVQRQQRSVRVHRRPGRVGLPEDVVEDLERQRPGVPGGQHVTEEGLQVEGALTREQSVVPAPLQQVHVHRRGIGELQEEQLLAGNVPDAGRIRPAGQDVEAVDAQPERRMIGHPHDVPRLLIPVDERRPGQGLVADPHAPFLGADGQPVQLFGDLLFVLDGVRVVGRTHQHQVGAQLFHDVELAVGPPQVVLHRLGMHGVEVPERLVEVDGQSEVVAPLFHLRRPTAGTPRSPARRSPPRRTRRRRRQPACPPACRRCRRWRSPSSAVSV